jgi:hypothetical protein
MNSLWLVRLLPVCVLLLSPPTVALSTRCSSLDPAGCREAVRSVSSHGAYEALRRRNNTAFDEDEGGDDDDEGGTTPTTPPAPGGGGAPGTEGTCMSQAPKLCVKATKLDANTAQITVSASGAGTNVRFIIVIMIVFLVSPRGEQLD